METISKIRIECNDANNTAISYFIDKKIVRTFEVKFKVLKSGNSELPINVQVWIKEKNGKFTYSGNGKYCQNEQEVNEYIQQY